MKLTGEPLRVISFGAGVQSTALVVLNVLKDERLEAVVDGLAECAIFADPQSESRDTYRHFDFIVEWCEERGFPVYKATRGVAQGGDAISQTVCCYPLVHAQ